jgi:hypothetical protein
MHGERGLNLLELSIGGLKVRVDISPMEGRLGKAVADVFSPFLRHGMEEPQETLHVLPARTRQKGGRLSDLESLIKESVRTPLSRFPFASNEEEEMRYLLKRTLPFLHEDQFRSFLSHSKGYPEVTLLPFARGILCRRGDETRSSLFLKTWSRKNTKVASIYGSVYFVSAVGLPSIDGLLMHGVGIVEQGSGLLFLGLPGDGKSTLARLSRPREVISDDGIIVIRRSGAYELVSTPFNQFGSDVSPHENRRIPLVMGVFLRKDERVHIERVPPLEACPIILRNHIHYFRYFPATVAERTFLMVADLCRDIPFYRLHFRKDPDFWPLLERVMEENSRNRGGST